MLSCYKQIDVRVLVLDCIITLTVSFFPFFFPLPPPPLSLPMYILYCDSQAYDSWQMGNILKLPCHNCAATCTASGCPAGAVADCCGNTTYTEKFLEYGVQMKASISAAVAAKPAGMAGAFVSGCIVHCQTIFNEGEDRWDHWKVGGKKPREVFHSFYFAGHDGRDCGSNGGVGGVGGSDAVAIDADVYPQNPSCPIWT